MPANLGTRWFRRIGLALAAIGLGAPAVRAADPPALAPVGRFIAVCDDLGKICFADTCGRDQIEAALACRAACPTAVVRRVEPAACLVPASVPVPVPVLRRRG